MSTTTSNTKTAAVAADKNANAALMPHIAREVNLTLNQVARTVELLDDGCTVPFISRYRKEATGALDEVQVTAIKDALDKLRELVKRKETVLDTIASQDKLTDALRQRINDCWNAVELEDIYLPYKPKRRTKAAMACEKGLEPLAVWIMMQRNQDLMLQAAKFVNPDKKVNTPEEAIQGAQDIIAEQVAEDEETRKRARNVFRRHAVITAKVVKGKEEEAQKFRDYFDYSEPLSKCPSHRLLAISRGVAEGFLRSSLQIDDEECIERTKRTFVRNNSEAAQCVAAAVEDGYKRLLKPSIETECLGEAREKADDSAIATFAVNLKQLLLAPPLGEKRTLAIDPGFRTGCKVVCLDAEGNLLHNEAIFPHPPKAERRLAANKLMQLIEQYGIEAISIGNGTASRETEEFVASLPLPQGLQVFVVSEDGASIYSASKTAREEFPDYDVTVRGAVSIGRRLMDPLAELVKIDPKSIGVGQYQYDVNQTKLKKMLDQTVEHCVNSVGVNLNTASKHLLTYVSGLGPLLAQNIVDYRKEHGAFTSRAQLKKVPRLGEKAFQQAAGFLRVRGGKQPLDNSAVHPENYALVEQMANDLHCTVPDLLADASLRQRIDVKRYESGNVGAYTLHDIMDELEKPGRDPRQHIEVFAFDPTIKELEDVRTGMLLPGIVTNITDFGCFVDVGVHTKGLVHISEMANRFVKSPADVVTLQQHVKVKVIGVDLNRKRMQLSLKQAEE